jgi:hypothetical protein
MSGGALTDLTDRPLLGGCHPATVRAILEADPEIRLEDNSASKRAYFFAKFHGCVDSIRLTGDEHGPSSNSGAAKRRRFVDPIPQDAPAPRTAKAPPSQP